MSRLLLTVSAVIRTPCKTGGPPEPAPGLPLSNDAAPRSFAGVPFALVPVIELDPKPFDDALLLFPFRDRRSDVAEVPDPGAIWLLAESSDAEDDPPMNISVRTRAIWRASPYFTR